MFNLLTDRLPETVMIDGEKCYLKTDFKNWIAFELIVTDRSLTDEQKLMAVLPICFGKLPTNPEIAVKACAKFYCGERTKEKNRSENSRPLYSFLYDDELIFSAFMSQYAIDLSSAKMHWYKFRALFKGLKADCKIVEIMRIRSINLAEIKDAEVRNKYRELKEIWRLPDERSEKEKTDEIVRAVEGLF